MTPEIAFLRSTVRCTHFLQAAVCIIGIVMALNAIHCAFIGHHGNACVCGIGVLINYATFEIAARTRARAHAALEEMIGA
jgi:hypothetical protein